MRNRQIRTPARTRDKATVANAAPTAPALRWQTLGLLYLSLVAALLLVYAPALHGAILWDDPAHLTRPELRTAAGLWRIWFEPGATQQYYPVVHSCFWLMSHLFGYGTFGYHLTNVLLHAASAVLVAVILKRIGVRGAICAAAVFALHPVQVESVAWMTELKNTLSGALCLSSLLLYLEFDDTRRAGVYAGAFVMFVLSVLAKSVTGTLPLVVLVLFWYLRGRIDMRRDVRPLVPFLLVGTVMGIVTTFMERAYIGATGSAFDLNLLERTMLAGRVATFYLARVFWPSPLIFVYPRWTIDVHAWWQYLYPAGMLALLALLWAARRWSRAPIAALLMFGLTIGPALGFVNVFPFKFSFVADHFQYLACLPIVACAVAACFTLAEKRLSTTVTTAAVLVILCGPLALMSHAYSREYRDPDTLYRATIAKNPRAWLAHNNLGMLALEGNPGPDDFTRALASFRTAMDLAPQEATVQFNVGTALYRLERFEEAVPHLRAAVVADPGYVDAWGNLGVAQQKLNQLPQAIESYRQALALKPDLVWVRYNISTVLLQMGKPVDAANEIATTETSAGTANNRLMLAEALVTKGQFARAVDQYQRAMDFGELPADALDHLGYALLQIGRAPEAEQYLRLAIARRPDDSGAYSNLGNALQQLGRLDEALATYRLALAASGGASHPHVHNDFGVALARAGQMGQAIAEFREAVRLDPSFVAAQQNLAKALQTH
jgi:tetratricopeptide (TPR) repeat protein